MQNQQDNSVMLEQFRLLRADIAGVRSVVDELNNRPAAAIGVLAWSLARIADPVAVAENTGSERYSRPAITQAKKSAPEDA